MARRQAKMGIAPSQFELQSSPPSGGSSNSGIKEETAGGLKGQKSSAELEQASRNFPEHDPQSPAAGGAERKDPTGEGAPQRSAGGEMAFAAVEGTRRAGVSAVQGGSKSEMVQSTNEEVVFKCPGCPEVFQVPEQLNEHMGSHTKIAPTKTFGCICGKYFATYRGLSKHWDYEPGHRPANPTRKQTFYPATSTPAAPPAPPTSLSEPTSPYDLDAPPLQSPSSTPSSPVYTKSLGRNLTYHSIIRTRQSSNVDQSGGTSKIGPKRPRGTGGVAPSNSPAAKMDSPESKDTSEGAKKEQQKAAGSRLRTRSLSGSDSTPPMSMRGTLSSADLVRSPMTRSSSAAMKTVEFVSLPSRKKRRRRTRTGEPQLEESPTSEEPVTPARKEMKIEEPPPEPKKVQEPVAPPPQPQQQQPVKRKRGRPPKHRKDPPPPVTITSTSSISSTPSTSATSSPLAVSSQKTTVTSTTTSLGSITSPSVGGEPPMEARPPVQPMEESPLPPTSLEGSMPPEKSALNLPLWESIGHKSQPASSLTKSEHTSSTQLQSLLSQQPSSKALAVPELPSVHPSIVSPPTSSCTPVIPSILPQLKSDTKDVCSSFTAQLPSDVVTSPPSSNTQCTYVITSKENLMSGFEDTPLMSSAGSRTTETNTVSKGKPVCKSPQEEEKSDDDEPEVIAVEPASSVAIDLTEDDQMEEKEFLGKPQHISGKAVPKHKLRREGKDREKEEKEKKEKEKKEKGKKEKEKEEDKKEGDEMMEKTVPKPESSAEKQAETENTDHNKEMAEAKAKGKPVGPQRPPSVFVSVLSGPEKKGERKMDDRSTSDVKSRKPAETESEAKRLEPVSRLPFTEPSMQMPYPLVSTPTYPYPGPYPPPPPMMFPPPSSPSSMYPPYYGGYPLPPGHYMPPPPPPMGMMPHPPPLPDQQSGTSQSQSMSSPFTYATSSQLPAVTTVGGVRVSILDKPPMQMPTVTVPPLHQVPPSRRPQSVPSSFNTHMDHAPQGPSSVIRSFMNAPSPEGMEMSHPPHSHPLSQAYRLPPGPPPGPPPPGYMPPPHQQSYVSVRLDPTGVPYVNWGPPPPPPHISNDGVKAKAEPSKPAHSEELPSQPVECPECGRLFKNNKALNGHMRLHGGFDWTKKPFTSIPGLSGSGTAAGASKTPRNSSSNGSSNEEGSGEMEDRQLKIKKQRSKKRSRSRSLSPNNKKRRRKSSDDSVPEHPSQSSGAVPLPVPRGPNVFTFDTKVEQHRSVPLVATTTAGMQDAGTMTQHRSATLDDLCRAVEELERMENGERNKQEDGKKQEDLEDDSKQRPGNIRIPQSFSTPTLERERHRFGATPPYTPPPILSPSRSMTMLAGFGPPVSQPCTPCRILPNWSSRRTSDNRRPSESDDSYTEPKINVGKDFQATLPDCNVYTSTPPDEHRMVKVWQPLEGTSHEDESVIDGYLELACSPAILHSGRNKEFAMHLLYQLGGSVKEAVRLLLSGKSLFTPSSEMTDYNYSGTKQWSARERQQFRRAWRVHRKQFHLLRSMIDTKRYHDIIEYYYSWKKYCNDEYRGRNRHHSEDILADDDYPHANSDTSSSGSADNEPLPPHLLESRKGEKRHLTPQPLSSLSNSIPPLSSSQYSTYDHLPIVYAPHTSNPKQTVHQYKCKYPGCNQIFTSIFALNGHIRIHGGSFYPKPSKVESGSSLQSCHQSSASRSLTFSAPSHTFTISSSAPPTSSFHTYTHTSSGATFSRGPKPHRHKTEYRSQQQLELARALLELPQPRSPAQSAGYHTPSPKPSPGKSKSPGKKKMSSSSPGEHEGYYPCNRCGRVFSKVKSRSAHMKSHIIKQT